MRKHDKRGFRRRSAIVMTLSSYMKSRERLKDIYPNHTSLYAIVQRCHAMLSNYQFINLEHMV